MLDKVSGCLEGASFHGLARRQSDGRGAIVILLGVLFRNLETEASALTLPTTSHKDPIVDTVLSSKVHNRALAIVAKCLVCVRGVNALEISALARKA